MRKLTIVLLVFVLTALSSQAQNVKHPNENADTLKHNSFGINISPVLASLLGGNQINNPPVSVLYKHYTKRFNYRLGIAFAPEISSLSGGTIYDENGNKTKDIYLNDGEIVKITDTTVMKRFDYHNSYILTLKTGIEKTKKTRIGTWIIGADLNFAYYKKDETYLYREAVKSDTINFNSYYTQYDFLSPNISAPYARGNFLKIGLNFVTGFEWKITKHLNIIAEVNPYFSMTINLSKEDYSDNEKYLQKTQINFLDFDQGFINVTASLKF